MAPLPANSFSNIEAFEVIGVDFTGPVFLKQKNKRANPMRYFICLFTCAMSRAVHLELCPYLNTDMFMQAFEHMACRKNMPSMVYSDNGGAFVKAEKELAEFLESEELQEAFVKKGIQWNFNAPTAAWWGGASLND